MRLSHSAAEHRKLWDLAQTCLSSYLGLSVSIEVLQHPWQ